MRAGSPFRVVRQRRRQIGSRSERRERYEEESMIVALYIGAGLIMAVGSLYFALRNRDFRKFLAGAFFVSSGILFYLYLADVSVPLLGTGFVETPKISGGRSVVHFILFLLCFYFGFVRKPSA
jgi:ABC-type Fe3+-siderophore transport system permease subunit